jgi:hypothetical protein
MYRHGSTTGEEITIRNESMRITFRKRLTGWGWAELFDASGAFVGVMEHLGEIKIRDQEMPMRLEALQADQAAGSFGERITFSVKAMVVQHKLDGTSFEQWIQYPFREPLMEGEVELLLPPGKAPLQIRTLYRSKCNLFASYVRGPWVKAGANSYGSKKEDAIFPGIEWLVNEEWSSGTDWFKDPWALRMAPHPNKVTIPMMAVSYSGTYVALQWDPDEECTRWFNTRPHKMQPVFASPNFIDRMNNHLMGLMVPDVFSENNENEVEARVPLELHPGQELRFAAELAVGSGTSLDAVTEWVKANGMPTPPEPRWPYEEALERIARAYANRFWKAGEGFAFAQHPGPGRPTEPRFASTYLQQRPSSSTAGSLKAKIDWCRTHPDYKLQRHRLGDVALIPSMPKEDRAEVGAKWLKYQREDGSFAFDPDGRHYMKDDFVVAREYLEPMGHPGDTALDLNVVPAAELITLWEVDGEEAYRNATLRALDVAMGMTRPDGGDFWETPLNSPNLLGAGHAALAFAMAYKAFGDSKYKEKAVYWLRSLLPFTHLWQPKDTPMLYNTKPCFCSSDWYFANWVRDHVQWEVLETFASSAALGIDWKEIDPELDWHTYQEGVTNAALRWMVDHTEDRWRPHNLPHTLALYRNGELDDCFADTHNAVTGMYGGMAIPPDPIAVNLLEILKRRAVSDSA